MKNKTIVKIEIRGEEIDFYKVEDGKIVFNRETLEIFELWRSVKNDFIFGCVVGPIFTIMTNGECNAKIYPFSSCPHPYEVIDTERLEMYNKIFNKCIAKPDKMNGYCL